MSAAPKMLKVTISLALPRNAVKVISTGTAPRASNRPQKCVSVFSHSSRSNSSEAMRVSSMFLAKVFSGSDALAIARTVCTKAQCLRQVFWFRRIALSCGMMWLQNSRNYIFLGLAVLAVIASHRLENSRIGRAWKYVRSDEDAARAMGINHAMVKLTAYVLGATFAAIGGCFYAAKMTAIAPETFNFNQSLLILLGVVLGGRGKIPGVILGALVLVIFPELFRDIGSMRMLVFAVSLLLIMLFRPAGIWPDRWK